MDRPQVRGDLLVGALVEDQVAGGDHGIAAAAQPHHVALHTLPVGRTDTRGEEAVTAVPERTTGGSRGRSRSRRVGEGGRPIAHQAA